MQAGSQAGTHTSTHAQLSVAICICVVGAAAAADSAEVSFIWVSTHIIVGVVRTYTQRTTNTKKQRGAIVLDGLCLLFSLPRSLSSILRICISSKYHRSEGPNMHLFSAYLFPRRVFSSFIFRNLNQFVFVFFPQKFYIVHNTKTNVSSVKRQKGEQKTRSNVCDSLVFVYCLWWFCQCSRKNIAKMQSIWIEWMAEPILCFKFDGFDVLCCVCVTIL